MNRSSDQRMTLCSAFLFLFLLHAVAGFAQEQSTEPEHDRPNIIFVLADDLGYSDIGAYGSEIDTPNLDRLARNGLRFTRMHNTSKCFPSRACLLTGLYATQAGMNESDGDFSDQSVSFGHVLKEAGYRTLFVGKHHSTTNPYNWGFHHYWGLREGAANYYNPGEKRSFDPGEPAQKDWAYPRPFVFDDEVKKPFTPEKGYYSTDTWTTWALNFLKKYEEEDRPFCLYLAYQAPHDPLQAPPEVIEKYEGVYEKGYRAIRQSRYRKQLEMGLLDQDRFPLSEPAHRNWEDLSASEKRDQVRRMQVYAAMIDRMDQNIGRLLAYLKSTGQFENTLFMFASDNGASAEEVKIGSGKIGSMTRWASLKQDWANVSNTPYRYYKNDSYQGGICTPFIVHWPGVVEPGTTTDYISHFIDIMPTLVDITGVTYPDTYRGNEVIPMQGKSLLPIFKGEERKREGPLFWEWAGGRAIYQDGWKLVKRKDRDWELFPFRENSSETNNVIDNHPERAESLKKRWKKWYRETTDQNP